MATSGSAPPPQGPRRAPLPVLPIWQDCFRCNRFGTCETPFPPSGECPHLFDHQVGNRIPTRRWPKYPHSYWPTIQEDVEVSSIFLRWQLARPVLEADFNLLRRKAIAGCTSPDQLMVSQVRWLLLDFVDHDMAQLHADFVAYYGLDTDRVSFAIHDAFNRALVTSPPEVVNHLVAYGGDWHRHLVDITRFQLWGLLGLQYLKLNDLDDKAFRQTFEQEWEALQPYRGLLFDFRVVPRLSWEHFVRYQQLPRGDATIRRVLSCYVTHQTLAYPHLLKMAKDVVPALAALSSATSQESPLPSPEPEPEPEEGLRLGNVRNNLFTEVMIARRLRPMYRPLIDRTVKRAAQNLELEVHQSEEREAIRAQVEEAFASYVREFDFYWRPGNQPGAFGHTGILGLTENQKLRREIDIALKRREISLRSQDIAVYTFAHYIEKKMQSWVRSHYPADPHTESSVRLASEGAVQGRGEAHFDGDDAAVEEASDSLWPLDENTYYEEEPELIGPGGTPYMLIQQAARRYGLSVDQLRHMDNIGSLPALRVGKMLAEGSEGKNDIVWSRLSPDLRLYPCTPEADRAAEIAKGRARTRSSHLTGQELNRKQAAHYLGASERQLRHLEDTQQVQPRRKGSSVVYDELALSQAGAALQARATRQQTRRSQKS